MGIPVKLKDENISKTCETIEKEKDLLQNATNNQEKLNHALSLGQLHHYVAKRYATELDPVSENVKITKDCFRESVVYFIAASDLLINRNNEDILEKRLQECITDSMLWLSSLPKKFCLKSMKEFLSLLRDGKAKGTVCFAYCKELNLMAISELETRNLKEVFRLLDECDVYLEEVARLEKSTLCEEKTRAIREEKDRIYFICNFEKAKDKVQRLLADLNNDEQADRKYTWFVIDSVKGTCDLLGELFPQERAFLMYQLALVYHKVLGKDSRAKEYCEEALTFALRTSPGKEMTWLEECKKLLLSLEPIRHVRTEAELKTKAKQDADVAYAAAFNMYTTRSPDLEPHKIVNMMEKLKDAIHFSVLADVHLNVLQTFAKKCINVVWDTAKELGSEGSKEFATKCLAGLPDPLLDNAYVMLKQQTIETFDLTIDHLLRKGYAEAKRKMEETLHLMYILQSTFPDRDMQEFSSLQKCMKLLVHFTRGGLTDSEVDKVVNDLAAILEDDTIKPVLRAYSSYELMNFYARRNSQDKSLEYTVKAWNLLTKARIEKIENYETDWICEIKQNIARRNYQANCEKKRERAQRELDNAVDGSRGENDQESWKFYKEALRLFREVEIKGRDMPEEWRIELKRQQKNCFEKAATYALGKSFENADEIVGFGCDPIQCDDFMGSLTKCRYQQSSAAYLAGKYSLSYQYLEMCNDYYKRTSKSEVTLIKDALPFLLQATEALAECESFCDKKFTPTNQPDLEHRLESLLVKMPKDILEFPHIRCALSCMMIQLFYVVNKDKEKAIKWYYKALNSLDDKQETEKFAIHERLNKWKSKLGLTQDQKLLVDVPFDAPRQNLNSERAKKPNHEDFGNQQENLDMLKWPRFSEELDEICYVKEKGRLKLSVRAEGYPIPTLKWWRNDQKISEADCRIENDEYGGSVLTIDEMAKEDYGTYSCIASSSNGEKRTSVLVVSARDPFICVNPESTSVKENSSFQLKAKALCLPLATMRWFKDGQPLRADNRISLFADDQWTLVLKIEEAKCLDAGTYECVACNSVGKAHAKAEVKVIETPMPVLDRIASKQFQHGSCASITIRANCEVEFIWKKGSTTILESEKTEIRCKRGLSSTLLIKDLNKADCGHYICYGQNSKGVGDSGFDINLEQKKEHFFIDEELTDLEVSENDDAVFKVCVQSKGKPSFIWKKSCVQLHPTEHIKIDNMRRLSQLTIKKARASDSGPYSCAILADDAQKISSAALHVKVLSDTTKRRICFTKKFDVQNVEPYENPEFVVQTDCACDDFEWFFDNNSLPRNKEHYAIKTGSNFSRLRIISAQDKDSGHYKCTARIGNTTKYHQAKLNVIEKKKKS